MLFKRVGCKPGRWAGEVIPEVFIGEWAKPVRLLVHLAGSFAIHHAFDRIVLIGVKALVLRSVSLLLIGAIGLLVDQIKSLMPNEVLLLPSVDIDL